MPKSKPKSKLKSKPKFKRVALTKTKKKDLDQKIIDDIRNSLSEYEHIFHFTVDNMRKKKLKDLRKEWKDSKFFLEKHKVMSVALRRSTKSGEVEDQLNLLSNKLKGQCGLLMTNRDVPDVLQWFNDFSVDEYARAGFVATKDVILPQGPLKDFSDNIVPHFRRFGLPISLEGGVVNLIKEYQVCKKGAPLTPEQASILNLLHIQLATFKVVIKCHWTKGKGFQDLDIASDDEDGDSDGPELDAMEEEET